MTIRDRFDLVIFDWAGTVVDFGCHAPVIALREAFARQGVSITEAQARRDMGKAKAEHVRALLRDPAIQRAWSEAHGRKSTDADVAELMKDLAPLMRDQAERAATLIEGARAAVEALRSEGIKVGSSTGYTREMMGPVLREAAAQGYVPDHLVCSGETPAGRPTPLMIYKACAELGVWPLSRVVKVDDTDAGVAEGRAAGCFTVGISASGNAVGLSQEAWSKLPAADRAARLEAAEKSLREAGADVVIESVAQLIEVLRSAA
ncbi:MAG: phosphonoacetaldehyde hydrolase [Pseudomonadota bacterium]|nr:phosphonoacetaldehyde hydrolase [Pseudomonadota bacterium]